MEVYCCTDIFFLFLSDYEPIPSSGMGGNSAPQVVLCISGAVLLCIHRSLQSIDNSPQFVSVHHAAGRSLLSHNLQANIHIFDVSFQLLEENFTLLVVIIRCTYN